MINLKGRKPQQVDEKTEVYIGRAQHMGGWNLESSIWANPFSDGPIEEKIRRFREYIMRPEMADLRAHLGELAEKRLACWCAPDPCHGDVLRELLGETDLGKIRMYGEMGTPEWTRIDMISGSFKRLRPDRIGPFEFKENGVTHSAASLLSLWTGLQLPSGTPKEFRTRKSTFAKKGSWWLWAHDSIIWRGRHIPSHIAYPKIFIAEYINAAMKTDEFRRLKDIVSRGHNIVMVGCSGPIENDIASALARLPMWHEVTYEIILSGMLTGIFTSETFPVMRESDGSPIFRLVSDSPTHTDD